jgi:alpha-beta hydrolase superfamily lysophospholipase
MPWWGILLIILGGFLVLGLIFSVFFTFLIAYIVYSKTLMRGKSGSWGRERCSEPGCIPLETMWTRGLEWKKTTESYIKEVEIKSKDGLKLVGEWFDYGFDKTVIILPGRRETLVYSYFYAKPYKDSGVNVLVIDQRAHGFSEGKYSTCGIKEAEDVSLWMKYLHDELNQKEIFIHGICVGTCCTSMVVAKYKPDYLKAVILDSMFISYKEIYKNHYLESGHKLFPVFYEIWIWFRLLTKCDINVSNPEKYMSSFDLPVLFIWGTKDVYCLPEKSKILYEKCASKQKEIEWFEGAEHSRVRLYDEERYDSLVSDFLARNI